MKNHVYISTPCKSGFISINYMMSMIASIKCLEEHGIKVSIDFDVGKAGIDLPRSSAATRFLEGEATHLMFIDDDMAWQPELVSRLISLDLDIVGVPYRQKVPEVTYNMRVDGGYNQSLNNAALIEVHDIATGLLLIKKRVFEELKNKVDWVIEHTDKKKVGMFFRHSIVEDKIENDGGKSYMSEDFFFCRLAREAGFQIMAYVDAETAHTGTMSFRGDYSRILQAITGEGFKDTLLKSPLRIMGAHD